MKTIIYCLIVSVIFSPLLFSCDQPDKVRIIFDTDANNELDDQFALMYLLANGKSFDVEGVTVNATKSGGNIREHYDEAKRIMQLAFSYDKVPLLKGADASFEEIAPTLNDANFDGKAAVDFIVKEANERNRNDLVVLAVGKLTNVALALKKDPSIASKMRVVWLGSNYPKPGEYNQDNDTVSLNFILNSRVPFEMVTVRYGEPSGTDAVRVTQEEIKRRMPGMGPKTTKPITGRHGGEFLTFGDYAVSLFEHIDYHGDPPSRALFDLVAVAILKNPSWGIEKEIPAPILINNQWTERPENARKITLWENFNRDAIINDFYLSLSNYHIVQPKL